MFGGLFNHKKTKSDDDWGQPAQTQTVKNGTENDTLQGQDKLSKEEKVTDIAEATPSVEEKQPEEQISTATQDTQETDTKDTDQTEASSKDTTPKPVSEDSTTEPLEEEEKSSEDMPVLQNTKIDENEIESEEKDKEPEDQLILPSLPDVQEESPKERTHFLDDFGIDVTRQAEEKKLHTIIERDEEIEKLIHILLKSKKNCPMIVGEQGVGKTALVHGLAQKIIDGTVPEELQNGYIVEINCIELAGLLDKKEIELNLESLLQKVQQFRQRVLLLLDDLSRVPDGIRTILTLLKTYLAKNSIQLIICVTPMEYQRYFSEDSFFQDICEIVPIGELSEEVSVKIAKNLLPDFEEFHHVVFDETAISRAVFLSGRYIGEAFLPEKALDIIDDAATLVKVEMTKKKRTDNHVRKKDVESIIAERTGIALTTLIQDETEVLLKLEEYIHQHFIDQQKAVSLVADVVRKGRSALADKQKPLGSVLFVGPSGTGKTTLAKVLATILFGSENAIIEFDISQENYKQKLLDAVYAKPYSVVFLKNIETAHQQTLLVLSEILSSGKVTDHKGNTVSFANSLIICTSQKESPTTQSEEDSMIEYRELPKILKQELINVFDEVIFFESLSQKSLQDIASLQIQSLNERLMKQNISLAVSDKVLERIAKEAFNPLYGAHLLAKVIESLLENPVATLLLSKTFVADDTINVTVDEKTGKFIFAKTMRNLTELPEKTIADKQPDSDEEEKKAISEKDNPQPTQTIAEIEDKEDSTSKAEDKKTDETNTEEEDTPHPLSFDTYHQQVKHAYSDLLSSVKKQ